MIWSKDIQDYADDEDRMVHRRRWILKISNSPIVPILLSIEPYHIHDLDSWESGTGFLIAVNGCYGENFFFEGTLDQAKEQAIAIVKPILTQLQASIGEILTRPSLSLYHQLNEKS